MKFIDNIHQTLKDDLKATIHKGSRISIAASYFSIFAYETLKKELNNISELRFIFTSPTFVSEKEAKEKREFYIPRLDRERSLYGTEYEIKLRNELSQKAIAKECAEWIKSKVRFKSNTTTCAIPNFLHVDADSPFVYQPMNSFTTINLGCDKGNELCNPINRMPAPISENYLKIFNELWNDKAKMQDVTDEIIRNITDVHKENNPEFIYYLTLYNIFNEFLEDISEDILPNDATGFKESKIWAMLYNFQQDAVLAIINKLEKFNGCILADSVGLGKTFTALAVVKYYENRNKSVLILCPKKLANNWNTYKDNYLNNPIAADRLNYDVLFHTDLRRTNGSSNGLDLNRLNWGNYDLVVIDESHNFRNGGKLDNTEGDKENRYQHLLNRIIRKGIKTRVLMLSATPVNNRFNDLKNQLQLAYEGDSISFNRKLNTEKGIDEIFRLAQRAFNTWSKYKPNERTAQRLMSMLHFDFFELLDSVTIARSRKHIEKYYDTTEIGAFPTRLAPISHRPPLTNLSNPINYQQIYEQLMMLNLAIYTPTYYILQSRQNVYAEQWGDNQINTNFTQANREKGIKRLMAINLMKRLESSIHAFGLTLQRVKLLIENTIEDIKQYTAKENQILQLEDFSELDEFDEDDTNFDELFTIGKKVRINLADMDYLSWQRELEIDQQILEKLSLMISEITPIHDSKLQTLLSVLQEKINNPINSGNKKIIIFTAFADTAEYLYREVNPFIQQKFGLHTAMITGSIDGRTTAPQLQSDMNTILTCFSPRSKNRALLLPNHPNEIDLLIATDCISEGQNLQDCDYLINYDIHWNPVRIIQRFGRIDRIGSINSQIQLVNFWPDISLDTYINLKAKVETRMKIVNMTATGDDNPLSDEEKDDLEYRRQQLERLQKEVVDMEDMSTGISIMDLGLNEFRLDLLEYIKKQGDIDKVPFGMHAIVEAKDELKPGVVYVLRNINKGINIDSQNRLHPFYLVYISNEQEIVCNHLQPKKMLDIVRLMCKGVDEPNADLCRKFNAETKDGRSMGRYSELLGKAISSIVSVKEDSELDSFFTSAETTALGSKISGLNDFELICFIVIK